MKQILKFSLLIILFVFLSGCDIGSGGKISVLIDDNGSQSQISASSGSSVKQVLESAGITLNALDKTSPITTMILSDDATITITRVTEEFEVEQSVVPFEQQTVKNESLPEGQSVLIQTGSNGIQQDTYRILFENGVETSRTFVSSEITQAAKPEIVMIGVQSPFTPQPLTGTVAYIASSNAWVMNGSTDNRRLVVATGDLDGRIFAISPDGEWLLYSRTSENEDEINSLWLVNLEADVPEPIATGISNVVNYADWVPGRGRTFSYSTVDPVPTPPGWNANNDLLMYSFDEVGKSLETKLVVDKNTGGISGWWGSIYEWSTNGSMVAYSRADSIGLVDTKEGTLVPLIEFDAYDTGSDWAWVPGVKWSSDDRTIFTTLMPDSDNGSNQIPALSAILLDSNKVISLVSNCGLFCYPVPSPALSDGQYEIAYLSAILPDQSQTSRYNLMLMDRDASNQAQYYPDEGIQGLSPQTLIWSPNWASDHLLAAIAQGNLILLDTTTGSVKQVTGDGSISKIDWK